MAAANAAAAAAPDQATRQAIVAQTRQALQQVVRLSRARCCFVVHFLCQIGALLQGAKKGDANAMDSSALSTTLGNLAAACDVLTPEERQISEALRAYEAAAARVGGAGGARGAGASYAAASATLSAATKALLTAMSKLQAASKANTKEMPAAFTTVADAMPAFVDALGAAMAAAPPDAKQVDAEVVDARVVC